jgi:hypothetical protein
MESRGGVADENRMRSVIGICMTMGTIAGSYLPDLWGAGSFSVASLVFGALGGVAGVMVGRRLQE